MFTKPLKTKFAPAERVSEEVLQQQFKIFCENELLIDLSNSLSQMLVVLNKERQIVYANNLFLKLLNLSDQSQIIGKRMGEAINCIYSKAEEGGCGTSEFCRTCGAVNAILESHTGIQSTKECRILSLENDALDLRVTSSPYRLNGYSFTIFAISDISHEKRRQTLERVFFHDVLNSAGGISGLSAVLQEINAPEEMIEIAQIIKRAADNMIEEIQSHRQISAAERGALELNNSEINSLSLLKELVDFYSVNDGITGKNIQIDEPCGEYSFVSDRVLLRRVLGNMIKNALEASLPKSKVTLSCKKNNGKIRFAVHNQSDIPKEIRHQLFQRSFSTKGSGRGIGTYSMKLLGENYLKGKVWFESSGVEGTTFFIEL